MHDGRELERKTDEHNQNRYMNRQSAIINEPEIPEFSGDGEEHPVLFEVVPPKLGNEEERFRKHCRYLRRLFDRQWIHALNLPEIHDESGKSDKGNRRNEYETRVAPREYARRLGQEFDTRFIVNRVTVQAPPAEQEQWLLDTYHEYGVDAVVLVGGESGDIDYPGPSVTETNRLVRDHLNRGVRKYGEQRSKSPGDGAAEGDVPESEAGSGNRTAPSSHASDHSDSGDLVKPTNYRVGNISIPTRRRSDFDEPDRMVRKVQSGADFFTTQIVMEMRSPVRLLKDFSVLLHRKEAAVPTIFWSFTPISEQKDVDFLRWLGVKIPDEVADRILSAGDPVSESIDWALSIWEEIRKVTEELPLSASPGINISVMGMRNFNNGIRMAEALSMAEITS